MFLPRKCALQCMFPYDTLYIDHWCTFAGRQYKRKQRPPALIISLVNITFLFFLHFVVCKPRTWYLRWNEIKWNYKYIIFKKRLWWICFKGNHSSLLFVHKENDKYKFLIIVHVVKTKLSEIRNYFNLVWVH